MARRRRRSDSGPVLWIVGGLALVLAIAILGGVAYLRYLSSQGTPVDKQTYCPQPGPVSVDAVLIDTSDPIGTATQSDLRNQFKAIIEKVPKGGLVAIYSMTVEPGKLEPLFTLCNPGNGDDLNEITGNPQLARARWEKLFNEPLEKLIVDLDPKVSATSSPIMAAIQAIKLDTFDSQKVAGPKRLTIISDMIEHTDQYSQYRSGPDFQAYLDSQATKLRDGALAGISFNIIYIRRKGLAFQTVPHIDFWRRWIGAYGGEFEQAIQLEGDN